MVAGDDKVSPDTELAVILAEFDSPLARRAGAVKLLAAAPDDNAARTAFRVRSLSECMRQLAPACLLGPGHPGPKPSRSQSLPG
jgi:hypothetical protein